MPLNKYRFHRSETLEEIRRLTSNKIRDHRIEVTNPVKAIEATRNIAEPDGLSVHVISMRCPA